MSTFAASGEHLPEQAIAEHPTVDAHTNADRPGGAVRLVTLSGKGGSGKSTSCLNIAAAAADAGWRVLLVDTDPRAVSLQCFHAIPDDYSGLVPAISGALDPLSAVCTVSTNLDILASPEAELELLTERLSGMGARSIEAVDTVLGALSPHYDLIVIDTANRMDRLNEAAIVAADYAISPSRCNSLDMPGARDSYDQVQALAGTRLAPNLRFLGLVWVMFHPDAEETAFTMSRLAQSRPEMPVFSTHIPVSLLASKAIAEGRPAVSGYPRSPLGRAYRALTSELLGHIGARDTPASAAARVSAEKVSA